jgi:hypothetical protein
MDVTAIVGKKRKKDCLLRVQLTTHKIVSSSVLLLTLHRPKTVFETIADLWNNPDFYPVATASDCHVDFHTAIICSYKQVEALSPAMPQRIEDIFTSMRSDLLRIIAKDGNRADKEKVESTFMTLVMMKNNKRRRRMRETL